MDTTLVLGAELLPGFVDALTSLAGVVPTYAALFVLLFVALVLSGRCLCPFPRGLLFEMRRLVFGARYMDLYDDTPHAGRIPLRVRVPVSTTPSSDTRRRVLTGYYNQLGPPTLSAFSSFGHSSDGRSDDSLCDFSPK